MKNKKLQKGIEDIHKLTLTAHEKERLLMYVLSSPLESTTQYTKPVRSPWTTYSFISFVRNNKLMMYGVTSGLIVVLCSSGIAYASTASLPGNALYPIKVNVVEPLHSALIFSLEAKAQYQSSLATERMIEAETLADENKLDSTAEQKLNTLLIRHTDNLNNTLAKIHQAKDLQARSANEDITDDDIVTNFQAEMNAHARVLDVVRKRKDILDQNTDETTSVISNTARENGGTVRNNLTNKETKKSDKYLHRKTNVQSIIDRTTDNLNQNSTEDATPRRQVIIDDTHRTLEEAKQLLKESEDEDTNGDANSAYSKLLDSESSAKEAGILLKTGLKFRGEDN